MKLSQMRKALVPALLGIIAVITEWIASGEFNEPETRTAIATLVTAVLVYLVKNEPPEVEPVTHRSPTVRR
jgi:hypothetical protein